MTQEHWNPSCRLLTAPELKQCREKIEGILVAPFDEKQAKGIGYNLSPSELVYSRRKKRPLPIYHNDEGSYIYIGPQDTVLMLSYEYLQVDRTIAGTFHSRVRSVARGLGNISTTLDPGWKGMLLLAINNPTSKRIKVPITSKKDGQTERCSLITMVVWEMQQPQGEADSLTLRLDNPPMRADIWNDLIEPPHRLWRNARYHKFREFIQELMDFKAEESPGICMVHKIEAQLLELEAAIYADKSEQEIIRALLKMEQSVPDDEKNELRKKFRQLAAKLKSGQTAEKCCEDAECRELLNRFRRECKYVILCDEVEQIHAFIHQNVEMWWERGRFSRIIHQYVLPNLSAFVASVMLFVLLQFGISIEQDLYLEKAAISILPSILSVVINWRKGCAERR